MTTVAIAGVLYRLEGRNLIKAKGSAPGQISLFDGGGSSSWDESKHPRNHGKFTSGSGTSGSGNSLGAATLAPKRVDEKKIASSIVDDLKDTYYDADGWDEGLKAEILGYHESGSLGANLKQIVRSEHQVSDGDAMEGELYRRLARSVLPEVDYELLHSHAQSCLSAGEALSSPEVDDPVTKIFLDQLQDELDAALDPEDREIDPEFADYRFRQYSRDLATPEAAAKWASRMLNGRSMDYDAELTDRVGAIASDRIDWEEVGAAVLDSIGQGHLGLAKAGKPPSPGQMSLFGGDFDEAKHKRDSSGKFTSGGGGGSSAGGLPVLDDDPAFDIKLSDLGGDDMSDEDFDAFWERQSQQKEAAKTAERDRKLDSLGSIGQHLRNPEVQDAVHQFADESHHVQDTEAGNWTLDEYFGNDRNLTHEDAGANLSNNLSDALPGLSDAEHEALRNHIIENYGDRKSAHEMFPESSPFVENAFDGSLVKVPPEIREWYHGYMNDPRMDAAAPDSAEAMDIVDEWTNKLDEIAGDKMEGYSMALGLA